MNIIVKPYKSEFFLSRPDTTWEKENRDFYCPDDVQELHYAPILFARISKAGKCINEKFAERYFDGVGYGLLLSIGEYLTENGAGYAASGMLDHTSFLPHPLYNPFVLNGENEFIIYKNEDLIFSYKNGTTEMIQDAIAKASRNTSLRIGDYIAIELEYPEKIAERIGGNIPDISTDNPIQITSQFCENEILNFKIIL